VTVGSKNVQIAGIKSYNIVFYDPYMVPVCFSSIFMYSVAKYCNIIILLEISFSSYSYNYKYCIHVYCFLNPACLHMLGIRVTDFT